MSLLCPKCNAELEPCYPCGRNRPQLQVRIDAKGRPVRRQRDAVSTAPAFECREHGVMPVTVAIDTDNQPPDPWWQR